MLYSLKPKQYLPFAILILVSLICRTILSTYALPYLVHVDETQILKDPLKILLTYKNLDFHIPTNLYNYILTFWHFTIFCGGCIAGKWHSMLDYENAVAIDSYYIIFYFRLLSVLFSVAADIILLRFIIKKINTSYSIKILLSLVIIFNPIVYNGLSFVKFDAICYFFYSILIYLGYLYFVENKVEYRRRLYLVAFLALATRIEEGSFLAGFLLYDFYVMYKHNLKSFLKRKSLVDLLPGIMLYCMITLTPLVLVYNWFYQPKIIYTRTTTFEYGIATRLKLSYLLDYKYYIINSLMILGPIVLLTFLVKLFRNNFSVKFLILPMLITNAFLALFLVKNVHYFLLSSVIILFVFVKYIEESKNKKLSNFLLFFTLFYFITYDSEILYFTLKQDTNQVARNIVMKNTTVKDTILTDGICDLRIHKSPQMLREQIVALKEVGGSTGMGLSLKLKESLQDSIHDRIFLEKVADYFWGKTKYEGRWLIGDDTSTIKKINPKLIVIFSYANVVPNTYGNILKTNYTLIQENAYHFLDPRLYYRNFYLFHSSFIFIRKEPKVVFNQVI